MHAPVSGKASSAESARPRVPADRQTRSSRACSEMTVMSAPVAHAWAHVAHTPSTQGAQRGPSRPWLGLICLPPRCRARKRQTTMDVNAAPYKIFNARTALSDTLGDRDPAACLLHDALQFQARTHRGAPAMGARGCAERAVGGISSA